MLEAIDFTNLIRRIVNIYENGHTMPEEELNRAIDGVIGQILQMVRRRKEKIVSKND